jgi:hypothetical protein
MKDLTENSLVECLQNIRATLKLSPDPVGIKPTKLIMVPYSDESTEQFQARVILAKHMVENLK